MNGWVDGGAVMMPMTRGDPGAQDAAGLAGVVVERGDRLEDASRVAALTWRRSPITLVTVVVPTPARRATSTMVGRVT